MPCFLGCRLVLTLTGGLVSGSVSRWSNLPVMLSVVLDVVPLLTFLWFWHMNTMLVLDLHLSLLLLHWFTLTTMNLIRLLVGSLRICMIRAVIVRVVRTAVLVTRDSVRFILLTDRRFR